MFVEIGDDFVGGCVIDAAGGQVCGFGDKGLDIGFVEGFDFVLCRGGGVRECENKTCEQNYLFKQ